MLYNLSIGTSNGYFAKLFSDPSFIGALLGAVITGVIALVVFKLEKRNVTSSQKEHFKKVYNEIKKNLNLIEEYADRHKKIVIRETNYQKDELMVLNKMFFLVSHELEKNDIKDIPYEVHTNFTETKDALETIKLCSEIFIEVGDLSFLKEDYVKDIDRLLHNLAEFKKHFNT